MSQRKNVFVTSLVGLAIALTDWIACYSPSFKSDTQATGTGTTAEGSGSDTLATVTTLDSTAFMTSLTTVTSDVTSSESTSGTTNMGTGSQSSSGSETEINDPCADAANAQMVAKDLGMDCSVLFGALPCENNVDLKRGELVNGLAIYADIIGQMEGYVPPDQPTSPGDVGEGHWAYDGVEKTTWLQVLEYQGAFFKPDELASVCFWTEDLFPALQALPDFYAVVFYNWKDYELSSMGGGSSTTTRLYLYGTSPMKHLTMPVRVVNNLEADFTNPQSTLALEAVILRCQVPEGGNSYDSYSLPLVDGEATFDSLDCYKQDASPLELLLQVDPDINGAGQQARIGIDPTTLVVRGGGQANNPTISIVP